MDYSNMLDKISKKATLLRSVSQHQRAAYLEKLGARMMDAHDEYQAAYENAEREEKKAP